MIEFGRPVSVSTNAASNDNKLPEKHQQSVFPFYLMLNPKSWDWSPRINDWVPHCGRLYITPGCSGVPDKRKGQPYDVRGLIQKAQADGWKILLDQSQYLRQAEIDVAGSPVCYFTKWDRPEIYAGEVDWEFDEASYEQFLLGFVGDGIESLLKPLPEKMRERKVRVFQKRVERLEERHLANPSNLSVKARYDDALKTLDAMKKASKPAKKRPSKTTDEVGDE